jgi:tetratricopeptide (TPR) repeat protein
MTDSEKTVFLSYRRNTSQYIARAIFLDLRANGYDVFMDVESIDSGPFSQIILNQIAARTHFVLILTPGSLERCGNTDDWLRREMETALELQRNIVPVLVDNFAFADYDKILTDKLADVAGFNSLNLYHDYFDAGMEKLRNRFLRGQPLVEIKPTTPAEAEIAERKIDEAASQPVPTPEEIKAEAYYAQGYLCILRSDAEGAYEKFSEAIQLNPVYAEAYFRRGIVRQSKGDPNGAVADWTAVRRLAPKSLIDYLARGHLRKAKNDLAGAIAEFSEAIKLYPNEAEPFYDRGLAHFNLRNHRTAIADFSEAIRLNSQYAFAYHNRGRVFAAQEHYDEAIMDFMDAIQLNPEYVFVYNSLGKAYFDKGDANAALEAYSEAIRLNPTYVYAFNNRARVYLSLGNYAQAIADYTEAIERDPQFIAVYKNRAEAYAKIGNYGQAVADYEEYLALGGGHEYRDQAWVEAQIQALRKNLGD